MLISAPQITCVKASQGFDWNQGTSTDVLNGRLAANT